MMNRARTRLDPRRRYYVLATCDTCGDVAVAGERTTLWRDATTDVVVVAYPCTRCGVRSTTVVPAAQLARLLKCGFPVVKRRVPAELLEPHPVAAPLTADDLLDFHELLDTTDYLVELLIAD